MIKLQTWEQAQQTRQHFRKETFEGHITDIIATHRERRAGEQAFLVQQDPNWVTPTHYHLEHQFQVITAGSGSIGRHEVGRLSVHYAAPETAYGPIAAGSEGISYLTMRMSGDTGAWYLHKPGSRERMQRGLKREQHYASPQAPAQAGSLADLGQVQSEVLIEPRADGLAAHLVRLPAGQQYSLASDHAYGGRYYVVTQGEVTLADANVHALTVAFATADEQISLQAGAQGAEVLVLQFPVQALATVAQSN